MRKHVFFVTAGALAAVVTGSVSVGAAGRQQSTPASVSSQQALIDRYWPGSRGRRNTSSLV